MGSIRPFDEDDDIIENVRHMKKEELLDMWVETQQLQQAFQSEENTAKLPLLPDVEMVIIHELRLRNVRM